jgi:hypothetical protein
MARIRFLSRQIYEIGGPGKGLAFPEGFVLDGADVGKVVGIDKPADEFVWAFLHRWTRRGVAEEVDNRARKSDLDEIQIVGGPAPAQVSQPFGSARRGRAAEGLDQSNSGKTTTRVKPKEPLVDLSSLTHDELVSQATDRGLQVADDVSDDDLRTAIADDILKDGQD